MAHTRRSVGDKSKTIKPVWLGQPAQRQTASVRTHDISHGAGGAAWSPGGKGPSMAFHCTWKPRHNPKHPPPHALVQLRAGGPLFMKNKPR